MSIESLKSTVLKTLEDSKAHEIICLPVAELTNITDYMIICHGTSDRHVKAIADHVATAAKAAGFMPLGMQGQSEGDWILVDLADIVVHVMLPQTRAFYQLEKLWQVPKLES